MSGAEDIKEAEKAKEDFVPVVEQLKDIYRDVKDGPGGDQEERYKAVVRRFQQSFGHKPDFFARAPGRVNLIGEHIDYLGYSVCPTALEQDFIMAVSVNDSSDILLRNVENVRFENKQLTTDPFGKFSEEQNWSNYVLQGFKAVAQWAHKLNPEVKMKGMEIMTESTVPIAAGVSSSSALTVVAAVATLYANNLHKNLQRQELTNRVIDFERQVGTACGGMDQTISIMAQMGQAKYIHFVPDLSTEPVHIPDPLSIVVANSLTPSPKIATLGTRYNKRVVECRFGVVLLCIKRGIISDGSQEQQKYKTPQQLQDALGLSLEEMAQLSEKELTKKLYSAQQLTELFKVKELSEVMKDIPNSYVVLKQNTHFNLRDRLVHGFREAARVASFVATCNKYSQVEDEKEKEAIQVQLGELMSQSHVSCRDLYECSSSELDQLVDRALKAGAYGSRLTGAGWGGCCVSIVKKQKTKYFIQELQKYYTDPREHQLWITDDLNMYLFATNPGRGALVLIPDYTLWF